MLDLLDAATDLTSPHFVLKPGNDNPTTLRHNQTLYISLYTIPAYTICDDPTEYQPRISTTRNIVSATDIATQSSYSHGQRRSLHGLPQQSEPRR